FYRTVAAHLAGQQARAGSQWDKRTPMIEIQDAAEIAVRALESQVKGCHTIPAIAPDGSHTYREVLHAAAQVTGLPARDAPGGKLLPPSRPPDLSAVQSLLGWAPSITLPQGMERFIAWSRTAITR